MYKTYRGWAYLFRNNVLVISVDGFFHVWTRICINRMGGRLSNYHIQQFSDASIDRHIISPQAAKRRGNSAILKRLFVTPLLHSPNMPDYSNLPHRMRNMKDGL